MTLQIAQNTDNKEINIYSDSLSLILSLGSPNFTVKSNPYLFDIKKGLILISQHKVKLSLYWIPAHFRIEGNEQADLKAKGATIQQYDKSLKIAYTDLTSLLKEG